VCPKACCRRCFDEARDTRLSYGVSGSELRSRKLLVWSDLFGDIRTESGCV